MVAIPTYIAYGVLIVRHGSRQLLDPSSTYVTAQKICEAMVRLKSADGFGFEAK